MKQKKNKRQRGGKTHGWGAMKKHRGAGNRGGRGNAGSGKRADQKKPAYWDNSAPKKRGQKRGKDYFGKHGFASIHAHETVMLNVCDLDQFVAVWATEKKATKSGDTYTVDLTAMGVEKLLGTGAISKKVRVTVAAASPGAVEKVAAAGGVVTITATQEAVAQAE